MAEWTEERVDQLKTLAKENKLSLAQIAARIGEVTRSACARKMKRLGLTKLRAPRVGVPRQPKPAEPRVYASRNLEAEAPVEIDGKHVTLVDLTSRHCKWPIGDPATEDFYFCGQPPILGRPYCEAHCRKAYTPMTLHRVDHRGREK